MKPLLTCIMIFLSLQSYLLGQKTVELLFTVVQAESPFKPIKAYIEIIGPIPRSGEFADDNGKLLIPNYQDEAVVCLIKMDGYKWDYRTEFITESHFKAKDKKREITVKLEKVEVNSFFVNGFVKGCNGMPVKGISVQVICGYDSLKIKQTDEWGWYQIEINLGKVGLATEGFSLIANFGDCLTEEIEKNIRRPGHTFRMDITKNCGCQGKGTGMIMDIKSLKPIPGDTIEVVINQEFPSSKLQVNNDGIFKLQNLPVGKNIAFKFTHPKYLPLIFNRDIKQMESENEFRLYARKKSSYYFSGHHLTYATEAIGLVFLIGGGCAYIKADNIHQAYTKNLNDQNFIAEYPQFNNREEGYAKVEKLRKTSAWMIPLGGGLLLIGHFVVHCLENDSYEKKIEKKWQSGSNSLSIYGSVSGIHLAYSFN